MVSRVFSGRAGRSIATKYVRAATAADAPLPAPYPVQRGLTAAMRSEALRAGDVERMQAWAGQSARLARAEPAGKVVQDIWDGAQVARVERLRLTTPAPRKLAFETIGGNNRAAAAPGPS